MIELWEIKKNLNYLEVYYFRYMIVTSGRIISSQSSLRDTIISYTDEYSENIMGNSDYNIYEKINEFETIEELKEHYMEELI